MIADIKIKNFKCFVSQSLKLNELTVLCGHNGGGKSTIVQSLLLCKQFASLRHPYQNAIPLNGPFGLQLGAVGDILSHNALTPTISFEMWGTGKKFFAEFPADGSMLENQYLSVVDGKSSEDDPFFGDSGAEFIYLGAERNGPRNYHLTQSAPDSALELGHRGEFTAEILARGIRWEVNPSMCHPSGRDNLLLPKQVEDWMSEFAPGFQIRTNIDVETNIASMQFKHRGILNEWMKPSNLGFGLSYCLPIITGGLFAKVGGVFVVDSPESHLHPRAQYEMGVFLATLSAAGVQVIVETHSDHLLNGIRVAVKRRVLESTKVAIHFFDRFGHDSLTSVSSPRLTSEGRLTEWPQGFFDQWDIALHELF